MDAETFPTWLGRIGSLTPDQRRQTFMMVALREADDESDLTASETGDEAVLFEAPAMIATGLGGGVQSPAVPSALPAMTDGKVDALTAAAVGRIQVRGCSHCDAKEVRPWGQAHGLAR
jgi:hypothetical protein